jgi:signal peptidase I
MSILLFLIVLYVLNGVTLMKLFEKAGLPAWKALVPGVAAIEWSKLIGRKPQYALWLLFPVVNFFIYSAMVIDLIRSFGRHGFWQSVLAVIFAPISFFLIGRDTKSTYEGPILDKEREFMRSYQAAVEKKDKIAIGKLEAANPHFKKTPLREWSEAIIFAVFAAAFIRMFLIEAYVIPTSSMEGSLKVGDFLFVSKAHYGIRTPMTVVQFPLLHNRFPEDHDNPSTGRKAGIIFRLLKGLGVHGESYLEKPSLPYFRLPAIEQIDRNDPVVFNWPVGDSVVLLPERSFDIGQWERFGLSNRLGKKEIITRPVDKKDHYIKRCVAIAGDSVQVRGKQLYINGQAAQNPSNMQFGYSIEGSFNVKKLAEMGVSLNDSRTDDSDLMCHHMNHNQVEKLKSMGAKLHERVNLPQPGMLFPNDPTRNKDWTVDNYGPIWVPKKGANTVLNMENIAYYARIIDVYEGNDLSVSNNKIYINGQEAGSYTFKQDYYWMMGDNRHNSEDSRVWGYVPADHVVGKPLFIWFSTKNANIREGINWNRIFKSANSM